MAEPVELIATNNILSSLTAIHRLMLTSLNHNQLKRPIPFKQPVLVESQSERCLDVDTATLFPVMCLAYEMGVSHSEVSNEDDRSVSHFDC